MTNNDTSGPENPFDSIISMLDQPMILVTAASKDQRAGCLVGFHSQSSIEPRRYVVWLSKANHTFGVAVGSTHLGVHFLGRGDTDLAVAFGTRTGDEGDKFAPWPVAVGEGGVPVLTACSTRFVGRRVALLDDGGDHVCITLEPVDCHVGADLQPLRLRDVADLDPGHAAEDPPNLPGRHAVDPDETRPGAAPGS